MCLENGDQRQVPKHFEEAAALVTLNPVCHANRFSFYFNNSGKPLNDLKVKNVVKTGLAVIYILYE